MDVRYVGHLRQHHDVQRRPRGRHHVDDVGMGPRRGPVVDPNSAQLPGPTGRGQRCRHLRARLGLGVGRDRIFEIEEDLIGGQTLCLVDHLRAAAGNRKYRSAGSIAVFHNHTLYPSRHGGGEQGLCGPTRRDGGAGARRGVPRPRPRCGDQHQHRAPTAARARSGRRIAHAPKNFRADSAGDGHRSWRCDVGDRQRFAAQVHPAPR